MAGKITAVGGFYSFISHGLGRELGLGAAFASVVAYSVFEASLCGGFAYFAHLKFQQHGHNIRWFWLALFMVGLIAVLTYFDIRVSARLLGIALIGEVIILTIMDVAIFGQGGNNISLDAINPDQCVQGLPRRRGPRGGRRRRRHLLRLLVVGRLRDGAELRRGVEGPEADRARGRSTSR